MSLSRLFQRRRDRRATRSGFYEYRGSLGTCRQKKITRDCKGTRWRLGAFRPKYKKAVPHPLCACMPRSIRLWPPLRRTLALRTSPRMFRDCRFVSSTTRISARSHGQQCDPNNHAMRCILLFASGTVRSTQPRPPPLPPSSRSPV